MHHKFKKHIIKGVYKGGALGALSREANLKQDVKTQQQSKHSGEDAIYGMRGLIRS